VPRDLLERWHTLAGRLAEAPRPPDVGRTLAALDPTDVDPSDPASVPRLDDFLAVIQATGRPLLDEDAAREVRTAMPEKPAPAPPHVEAERVRRILADL
jgi:hypothetical protein